MNYDNPTQLEPNKFNNKKKTDASLILKILETMKNTPPLSKKTKTLFEYMYLFPNPYMTESVYDIMATATRVVTEANMLLAALNLSVVVPPFLPSSFLPPSGFFVVVFFTVHLAPVAGL